MFNLSEIKKNQAVIQALSKQWIGEFSSQEIDELRNQLEGCRAEDWCVWCFDQTELFEKAVESDPLSLSLLPVVADCSEPLKCRLALIYHLLETQGMVNALARPILHDDFLQQLPVSQLNLLYSFAQTHKVLLWPFDCQPPFSDWDDS